MVLPEIRFLQAAIALAEELNFSRAAERLRVDQSTLSKRIADLESLIGVRLFERNRNRQSVELTEAGRHFVAEARSAILHTERAVMNATAAARGADEILHIGKSAYTDPYLVTTLLSIQLPLYPSLKVKLWSNYSHELAHMVATGELDLALITAIPDTPELSSLTVADNPIYIALSTDDALARNKKLRLEDLRNCDWILLASYVSPHVFERIHLIASEKAITVSDMHYVMTAEEASELVQAHKGVAFLPSDAAWRIACDEVTIRPLMEERLRLVTRLATRSDNKARLVSEFVRAAGRKMSNISPPQQGHLPLAG
jgi:DNA-binding transcriptional LysR family regulator